MKKLIALIGAVATAFGLSATEVTQFATSFEAGESGVDGTTFTPGDAGWSWDGGLLSLAAYGDGEAYAYGTGDYARRFDGDNLQYLPLETGDKVLSRSLGEGNTTVDQLVKFTGYDAMPTEFTPDSKFAVWMLTTEGSGEEPGETNLYVTCGADKTSLKLIEPNGAEWVPEKWYRLTVKSLGMGEGRESFNIYIDGKKVEAVTDGGNIAVFPSMMTTAATTMNVVGMGAIDDITIDENGPLFTQNLNVTFEIAVTGATVTKVMVDDEEVTPVEGKYTTAPGAALKVTVQAPEGKFFADGSTTKTIDATAAAGMVTIPEDATETKDAEAKIGTTFYLTLQKALDVGGDIELLADVEVAAPLTAGANFTLDLGDKTVSGEGLASGAYLFELGDKTVTIVNGDVESNQRGFHVVGGSLTIGTGSNGDWVEVTTTDRGIGAYAGSTVCVNGSALYSQSGDPTIFVRGNTVDKSTTEGAKTVLNLVNADIENWSDGGVISGNGWDWIGTDITITGEDTYIEAKGGIAIYKPQAGDLTIDVDEASYGGIYVYDGTGIYAKSGSVNIKSGYITVEGYAAEPAKDNDGATSTGDALVLEKLNEGDGGYANGLTCAITGGTLSSENGYAVRSWKRDNVDGDPLAGFISGGRFKGIEMPVEYIKTTSDTQIASWSKPDGMGYVTPQVDEAEPLNPEEPTYSKDPVGDAEKMNGSDGSIKPEFINVPAAAGETPDAKAAYAALFKAVPGDGVVTVELNDKGTNALKVAAANIETAVAAKLGDISAADEGATIALGTVTAVTPGFYYGVAATADLGGLAAVQPDDWQQATSEGVTLTANKPSAEKGFFQTRVSVKAPTKAE